MQEGRLEYSKAALLAKVKDQAERHKLLGETLEHSLSVGILRNRLDKLGAGVDKLHQRAAKLARALKRSKLGPVKEGQVAELLGQLEALL
jgi:ParB family chromosome partitioning protein